MSVDIPEPEFSVAIPLSEIGGKLVSHQLSANTQQRAALAQRFDLLSLDRLTATVTLCSDDQGIVAKGTFDAALSQTCVASGVPVPATYNEPFIIRFVPEQEYEPDAEIELTMDDCDTMFHNGRVIDLGEAVAQTLALSIDPFPRSADADVVLKAAGIKDATEVGPFAALAALRKGGD
jgi:uncharacterized metal-binding protein YceD (DUF177 family)